MTPNRIQLDIRGLVYTLPINPIEYEGSMFFANFIDKSIDSSSIRFEPYRENRVQTLTWRNLPNRHPYTQLVSGLKNAVGISGVKINFRDLNIVGDENIWMEIYMENVSVKFIKGKGKSNAVNNLSYDIQAFFSVAR